VAAVRPFSTRSTPAAANASAQPRPKPLDDAQTSAFFDSIPSSMLIPFPMPDYVARTLRQSRPFGNGYTTLR
jgi:hypothetical protein